MDVECALVDGHVGVESTSDATSSREEGFSFFSNCLFVYSQFGVRTADYYPVIGWAFGGRDPENGAGGRAARAERPGGKL